MNREMIIEVQLTNGRKEVVLGWKLHYPTDGRLLVTDDDDLVVAAFGPGKWIAAIVKDEAPKPEEAK